MGRAHSKKYEYRVGVKEKPDPICLTKAEMKRVNNWLDKYEYSLYKKERRY